MSRIVELGFRHADSGKEMYTNSTVIQGELCGYFATAMQATTEQLEIETTEDQSPDIADDDRTWTRLTNSDGDVAQLAVSASAVVNRCVEPVKLLKVSNRRIRLKAVDSSASGVAQTDAEAVTLHLQGLSRS